MATLSDNALARLNVALASPAASAEIASALNGFAAVTPGTVAASSAVVVDANKDVSGLRNVGMTAVLTVGTTTGTSYIAVADNLAAAYAIKEGSNSYVTIVTTNGSESVVIGQHLTMADAKNIIVNATTGTSFGSATTQKISHYGVTPIVQRAGAAQAAVITTAATQTTPFGFATQAQADAIVTLVNELRAAMVAFGTIKGAA